MKDEQKFNTPLRRVFTLFSHSSAQVLVITLLAVLGLIWAAYFSGPRSEFLSLWLDADQQGRLAYERRDYARAEELFQNALWKAAAAYANGDYLIAAEQFGRISTPTAFFNRGNAYMKGREYAKAIVAYEQALIDAPEWREASENLELARYVLDYVERTREQGDTGDETELGADDITFDNTRNRGKTITITDASVLEQQSTELWMRSVDTHAREYLRIRFALELSRSTAP